MKFLVSACTFFQFFVIGATAQTSEPKLVSAREFHLPQSAEAAGIDGKIRVGALVDTTGSVLEVKFYGQIPWPCGTSPKKEIDETLDLIRANVMNAKFTPAIKSGKPHESEVLFDFVVGKAYREMLKQNEAEVAAAAGKPLPRIVDLGVIHGRAVSLPSPAISRYHNPVGKQVSVSVRVVVDETGKVASAGVHSGPSQFHSAVRDAACVSRFSPTQIGGQPVKVSGVITYTFIS